MNITNFNKNIEMTSREIAKLTYKEHKNVKRDIENMLLGLELDRLKFERIYSDSMNREQLEYILPKDEILCLIAGYNVKLRMAIIKRIDELEKQLSSNSLQLPDFSNPAIAARAWADQVEKNLLVSKQLQEAQPKILFANAVSASKSSILVGELAKILKQNGVDTGANRLFSWLRDNGYLIKRFGSDYNTPTQKSMNLKLFELKETAITHSDGHVSISKTTKVTPKGQEYFINKFLTLIAA
ncbi:phage regulatory protein/antirepressor Ant [Francisella hispaniensis]|uniref:Phage anti-repressor, putative n=1 Tax=Francisella hispaniensis TaxID=622488 RepID=F4BFT0_9GAMM|nr:phage regulatory protein/antirepressor Ant [Francisella hispaniensis]AEE26324.1 phage anti-repressor, putative [Francisella hispaniensis]